VLDEVATFHFSNCVTDKSHPLYGDRHIKFGSPGVLDTEGVARLMKGQEEIGFLDPNLRPSILCEVLHLEGEDSLELVRYCRAILTDAWALTEMLSSN